MDELHRNTRDEEKGNSIRKGGDNTLLISNSYPDWKLEDSGYMCSTRDRLKEGTVLHTTKNQRDEKEKKKKEKKTT